MSERWRMTWLPWRGPNPVRWTLALALSLLAIVAAVLPTQTRTPAVHPLASWAALLALGLAMWASLRPRQERTVWPWHGPDPLRNTVAFVLTLLALALLLVDSVWRRADELSAADHTAWMSAVATTLLFVSAVASTWRGGWGWWVNRLVWGCFAAVSWWQWYQWQGR